MQIWQMNKNKFWSQPMTKYQDFLIPSPMSLYSRVEHINCVHSLNLHPPPSFCWCSTWHKTQVHYNSNFLMIPWWYWPLDEVPVSPAHADQALGPLGGSQTGQAGYLSWVRPEHGDWAQTRALRHHQAAPAGANIDEALDHGEGRHLTLAGAELVINVDRDQGLAAGDQLTAVKLVHQALGLNIPEKRI